MLEYRAQLAGWLAQLPASIHDDIWLIEAGTRLILCSHIRAARKIFLRGLEIGDDLARYILC